MPLKVVQTPGVKLLFGGVIKNIYSSTNDTLTLVRRRILVPIYWCTVSDFRVVFYTAIMYDKGIFYYVCTFYTSDKYVCYIAIIIVKYGELRKNKKS